MKKIYIFLSFMLFTIITFAQVPQKMSYQAIIRDNTGKLLQNTQVRIKISIIKPSVLDSVKYQEIHEPFTNANGLVSLIIGDGMQFTLDSIQDIDWASGPFDLLVETDPQGGLAFPIKNRNQLLSVPYALYAANGGGSGTSGPPGQDGKSLLSGTSNPLVTTGNIGDFYINVFTNQLFGPKTVAGWGNGTSLVGPQGPAGPQGSSGSLPSASNPGDMLYWNGTQWVLITGGVTGQTLTFCNGMPKWGSCDTVFSITTNAVSGVTVNTANVGGYISGNGTTLVTSRGICYGTSPSPTIFNNTVTLGSGIGGFSTTLSGLALNTTYYVRAFATNNIGTSYGNQELFTTLSNTNPTVTTTSITGITSNSATGGGNVTNNGANSVIAKGVCWSTSTNPTLANFYTTNGSGTGIYTSNITGLTAGTTYYVKAYATNSSGTSYGNQVSFTTSSVNLPSLSTITVSNISSTSAISGGENISSSSSSVISKGICWNTSPNPTIANFKTSDGTGTANFSSNLTGLSPGTTYYVRAYAESANGVGYGNEVSFTTYSSNIPVLTTTAVSGITSYAAVSGGNITFNGGNVIIARGICWSTLSNPDISGLYTSDGTGSGSFTSYLTGLNNNTTYYVRAYATNSNGTYYGNQLTFTTIALLAPTINTVSVTNITTVSAIGGGNITSDGGSAVTGRGLCWSTAQNPDINGLHTSNGSGIGVFTSSLTGLTAGTTYYVRAYATNGIGTSYGLQQTFNTVAYALPTVSTTSVSGIGTTTAVSGGNVTNDGGSVVTEKGVCWSTSSGPVISNSHTSDGAGTGSFNSIITGLNHNTLYYVRAFATNIAGTAYGTEQMFTTNAINPPVLTTGLASNITNNSATSGGSITSDGGGAITVRGVCWNTSPNPTTAGNKTVNGTGVGIFSSDLTGLSPNTTYYIRAYATNSVTTSYGNEVSFTTTNVSVEVVTSAVSNITSISALSGGNITSNLGQTVIERGVCWNTSPNPTTANNKSISGTGTGLYSSNLTGLLPNTNYYLRAYAITNSTTAYGNQLSFTTLANSTINSTVTDINGNVYDTIKIGNQVWLKQNLKVANFSNGDPITLANSTTQWSGMTAPAYCQYNYSSANATVYGNLYNNYAVTDSRNLCPSGWHIATDNDWIQLENYLGGSTIAGGKLKKTGTQNWASPNTGATNSSNFTALPGGKCSSDGSFAGIQTAGYWWTSTYTAPNGIYRRIDNNLNPVNSNTHTVKNGLSVRCVKN